MCVSLEKKAQATRPQWDKLPIGTILLNNADKRFQTTCEFYRYDGQDTVPAHHKGSVEGFYEGKWLDSVSWTSYGHGRATPTNGNSVWRIAPENFADAYRRDELAKIGFFSVDRPEHQDRRRREALEEAKRVSAYAALSLDRDAVLNAVAAGLADKTPEGIWLKSTIEFAKRREALDNAILYATGARDHA